MSRSIRRANRSLRYGDASKLIADRWARMPSSEKTYYHTLAAEDRRRYALELIRFRIHLEEEATTVPQDPSGGNPVLPEEVAEEVAEAEPSCDASGRSTIQNPTIPTVRFVAGNAPNVHPSPPVASSTERFQEGPVALQHDHQASVPPVVAGNTNTNNGNTDNGNNGTNELELFSDEDLQFLEEFGDSI